MFLSFLCFSFFLIVKECKNRKNEKIFSRAYYNNIFLFFFFSFYIIYYIYSFILTARAREG